MEVLLGIGVIVLIARIIKGCASPTYPAIDDWELYWEDHKIYDDEQIRKFRLQGRYNHRKTYGRR